VAVRIVIGLVMTVAAAAIAGRRLWWLGRLGLAGQPARAKDSLEVIDVAQLLARSVTRNGTKAEDAVAVEDDA
jgi:hypothetical protein